MSKSVGPMMYLEISVSYGLKAQKELRVSKACSDCPRSDVPRNNLVVSKLRGGLLKYITSRLDRKCKDRLSPVQSAYSPVFHSNSVTLPPISMKFDGSPNG